MIPNVASKSGINYQIATPLRIESVFYIPHRLRGVMAAPTGNLLNGGGGALGGRTEIRYLSNEKVRCADRDAAPCNDLHSTQFILALGRLLGSGTH